MFEANPDIFSGADMHGYHSYLITVEYAVTNKKKMKLILNAFELMMVEKQHKDPLTEQVLGVMFFGDTLAILT